MQGMSGERWHNLATALCSQFIGKSFARELAEMRRAQWMDPEQLRARMNGRLARILHHAACNVPYYQDVYRRSGLRPGDLRTAEDLRALPVMTKSDYRAEPDERFFAGDVPAHRRMAMLTSGSTGEPLSFHIDRDSLPVVFASHLHYDSWYGLGPFDRQVRIMAEPQKPDPLPDNTPALRRLRYGLTRQLQAIYESRTQLQLHVSEVNRNSIHDLWQALVRFRPVSIMGYVSTLATLADEFLRAGLSLPFHMKGVVTIAETLTPMRRRLLEDCFGAPLINRYGQREFKFWAGQCCSAEPEQIHMNTELVTWEILRADDSPAAPGESGRLVMTNLYSYARPFIRYDTGDIAVAARPRRCACGRGFDSIAGIEGRSGEVIITSAGHAITPTILGHQLFVLGPYAQWIRQYQLVMDGPASARFLAVPVAEGTERLAEALRSDLESLFGGEFLLSVEFVHEIPLTSSGKRPIIRKAQGAAQRGETLVT